MQDFLALVRAGNFSRAAAERHVTQSAFSRRIQALEEWVGAPLFDRTAQPIELTPAGQRLLPIAVTCVEPLLDFRAAMRSSARTSTPTVNFLMPTPCSAGVFPTLLARLNRELGPLICRGAVRPIDEVAERYGAGDSDLALSYRHPSLPRPPAFQAFECIDIGDDPLLPVCAPEKRALRGYGLPLPPATDLVYLPYGRSSFIGRVVDGEVNRRVARVAPQRLFDDPQIFVLKELALQGLGVAWLPRSTIERNLADGSLARADDGSWEIPLTVELIRRRRRLPEAAETVWALLARGAAGGEPAEAAQDGRRPVSPP